MTRLVLTSFTPLNASGGVPRWNRDFVTAFPGTKHFSWSDVGGQQSLPEWECARVLASHLIRTGQVTRDDIIIGDGFWADGYAEHGIRTVSVAHGIWSHLTHDDVLAGMQPEFPYHHAAQVRHRRKHLENGGKIVAVSDFIAHQMKLQWGFDSTVINTGIDLDRWKPLKRLPREKPIVVHGVTTANKGFDHVEALKRLQSFDLYSLDGLAATFDLPKNEALTQADLMVHPSAYEGNSMFVLESLACDVPVVGYDVGLLWRAKQEITYKEGDLTVVEDFHHVGRIMSRRWRCPEATVEAVDRMFKLKDFPQFQPRSWVSQFNPASFAEGWRAFLSRELGCSF